MPACRVTGGLNNPVGQIQGQSNDLVATVGYILGPCQAAPGLPSSRCLRATLFSGVVGTLQSRQGPSHTKRASNEPSHEAKALRSTKRCPLRAAEGNDGARRELRGLARSPARARGDGQMRPLTGGAGLRVRHRKAARARRRRRRAQSVPGGRRDAVEPRAATGLRRRG